MGKRKHNAVETRRKKQREQNDALLLSGVFSKGKNVDDWENQEQDYELAPRTADRVHTVEALPIKKGGVVQRVIREVESEENLEEEEPDDEPEEEPEQESEQEPEEAQPEDDSTPQEKLAKIKEEIASYASKLMEDPEENISCLTKLRKLAVSLEFASSQLAILALVPVFKSLAPGYQIRPLSEAEQRERVSKEIAKLRNFEQSLVVNYQHYIEHLAKLARVLALNSVGNKKITPAQVKQGHTATSAACELCHSSLKYFNFHSELFTIPIRRLNRKPSDKADMQLFHKCLRTLETLLQDDKDHGSISYDIVRLMYKAIKDKKFRVDESVVNVLLSLSLLADYDPTAKNDPTVKIKKKDRVHLSKKQKKARKEMRAIEDEMRKAEQTITKAEREKFQALTLKLVLKLYLEILQAASPSMDEKLDAALLMAAVLEGLSRFGQMANFDLFGDFLEVLREIMQNIIEEHTLESDKYGMGDSDTGGLYTKDEARKVLLSVVAAFALTVNHKEVGRLSMSVDLSKFVAALYKVTADLSLDAEMEFSHKSLRLADPLDESGMVPRPAVNVSTEAELLLKSLDFIFFRSRVGSHARAAPFIKRLYIATLQTPEKTSIALLKFVGKLLGRYGETLKGMWSTDERISGEGNYILGIERDDFEVDIERTNIGSAVLWENVLLDKHYCPIVRDGLRSLMKSAK